MRIFSGFKPHALMISLRASILLTLLLGFIDKPAAMYMPLKISMAFIYMSW